MKQKLQIIASAFAALFLAVPAPAQNTAKASRIMGMTVEDLQNKKLGKVVDFAVDVESGRIVEVILSSDGVTGIDSTHFAVPPEMLHPDTARKVLHMDASEAEINAAPGFELANWNLCTQSNRVLQVYDNFGLRPYFVPEHGEYRTNSVDGVYASSLPRNSDGSIITAGGRSVDTAHNEEVARDLTETNNPILTQYPEGTWTTNQLSYTDGSKSTSSTLVYVEQLGKLMGKPVKNLQGEKLGNVENFMVNLSTGRIVAVVISSGGVIGITSRLSAVSPTELQYNAENHTLELDYSKAMLANSPHYQARN
jgi:sporulation protein YlmC with PRC-barrel domain